MVVGPAGRHLHTKVDTGLSQRLGVLHDLLRVGAELGFQRLAERDSLGGNRMGQRSAEHGGAALVHPLRKLRFAKDDPAPRAPESLVRGAGYDMRVRHWLVVARKNLPGYQ